MSREVEYMKLEHEHPDAEHDDKEAPDVQEEASHPSTKTKVIKKTVKIANRQLISSGSRR